MCSLSALRVGRHPERKFGWFLGLELLQKKISHANLPQMHQLHGRSLVAGQGCGGPGKWHRSQRRKSSSFVPRRKRRPVHPSGPRHTHAAPTSPLSSRDPASAQIVSRRLHSSGDEVELGLALIAHTTSTRCSLVALSRMYPATQIRSGRRVFSFGFGGSI